VSHDLYFIKMNICYFGIRATNWDNKIGVLNHEKHMGEDTRRKKMMKK